MSKVGMSLMSILISILAGYALLLGMMYIFQNKLIFLPSSELIVTPEKAGLRAEEVWIDTKDGERLHGWFFPNDDSEYVVVLSHGNAGNISGRIDIAKLLSGTGVSVLLYDYRGYGQSSGKPTEEGLYIDVESVVNYLKAERGYSERQMIMYGRSMGGAVASYAATKFDVSGLVLDSAFKNLKAMVSDLYPFVPASLARYELPTESYLHEIQNTPVMIMHSPNDTIVDFSHGRHLYQIAKEPKRFVELRGGHNENFHASIDIHTKSWKEFLQIIDDQKKYEAKRE
ncbi:MAG: alpha/beta hydrolase [Balneolaceae bacterium]|nr:alpha/beta hydrolase [Balneolaceae bacterium]